MAAKGKKGSLAQDPRYKDFVARYAFDLPRFAIEVCGQIPTDQQLELFASVQDPGSRTSVSSGHGCFAKGTEIMRADGSIVAVEDVRIGDRLMGPDGKSVRTVEELRRGREAMYRITYMDGTSHVFNESHILCLVATSSKEGWVAGDRITVTVREWLAWSEDKKRCHAAYRSGVERFDREPSPLAVPPYILGVWLGDGDSRDVAHATTDPEIVGAIEDKRIPDRYLYAPLADRLQLLAGLIDAAGARVGASFDFIQKSERLARQAEWLARSVGCHSTIVPAAEAGGDGARWHVAIGRNLDKIPVRVHRKVCPASGQQRDSLHFGIRSCEALGEGDYYGFTLDGDSRFLGGDFTVLHNTGKTRGFGVIGIWHLVCYLYSNTYLTGPKLNTVAEGVWKEFSAVRDAIEAGPHAWVAEYLILQAKTVYIRGCKSRWFITARTAPKGAPEGLAGTHEKWLMWMADEASGIPDANFGVIGGALTGEYNRLCIASQPTRSSGFFYDTHHRLSKRNGGRFTSLVFNSEESPLVSDEFIAEKLVQYGGRSSPEYQIKVLGRFPENSDKYLLGKGAIEKCIGTSVIGDDEPWGNLLIIDVAAGVFRDRTVATHIRVIGNGDRVDPDPRRVEVRRVPIYTNGLDWTPVARMATDYAAELSNCTVLVDCGGQGIQFAKRMEEFGCPNVIKVNWGLKPFKKRNRERFFNLRSQCNVLLAEAVKDGRISFTDEYRQDLLDQGSRIPFWIDERGLWHIQTKEDMARDGIPSPDYWDTIAMGFLEGATYIQAEATSAIVAQARVQAAEQAALEALKAIS